MSQREETIRPAEMIHPHVVNGKVQFTSPEFNRIIDKLQNGDPTLGWEGDPRLCMFWREDGRWEVARYEPNESNLHTGGYSTVCVSRPGVHLDERLIQRLVEHDHRRGFDPLAVVEEFKPTSMSDEKADQMRESLEKVYHGAAKDLGVV